MNINIKEIVDAKIDEMNQSGVVKKTFEENIEKLILNAITKSFDSYSIERIIKDQLEKQVQELVSDIGFTAYNSFLAEKIKQLTESELTRDLAEKVNDIFSKIFINKRESIKLSEICKFYKDYICGDTDESEKYSLERFYAELEDDNKSYGNYLNLKLSKEKPDRYESPEIYIHFSLDDKDETKARIVSLNLSGKNVSQTLDFRYINKLEAFFINLLYNKTAVEIDINEDDIDTSFDVDI